MDTKKQTKTLVSENLFSANFIQERIIQLSLNPIPPPPPHSIFFTEKCGYLKRNISIMTQERTFRYQCY